ncbi:MAG: hypothetical protein II367_05170 [Treponema sp.]|nr:hypothetical protein [Treponema sp.]
MYDQYNENFAQKSLLEQYLSQQQTKEDQAKQESVLTPNDEGFDEEDLLYEEYFVYDDGTLNLAAPYDCYDYKWIVRDPSDGYSEVKILKFWDKCGYDTREFIIYLPTSGLVGGKTYQLTLSLRNRDGKVFSDSCGLVVYDHYNYVVLEEDKLSEL